MLSIFLDKLPGNQPFFLLFASRAPHSPTTPAPGDEHSFPRLAKWRPPNFNPADQSDKPTWLKEMPQLSQRKIKKDRPEFAELIKRFSDWLHHAKL